MCRLRFGYKSVNSVCHLSKKLQQVWALNKFFTDFLVFMAAGLINLSTVANNVANWIKIKNSYVLTVLKKQTTASNYNMYIQIKQPSMIACSNAVNAPCWWKRFKLQTISWVQKVWSSLNLLPEDPFLFFNKVLVRCGLSKVPLPLLLLLEGLHSPFLGRQPWLLWLLIWSADDELDGFGIL